MTLTTMIPHSSSMILLCATIFLLASDGEAFQGFKLPQFFTSPSSANPGTSGTGFDIKQKKAELLKSIANTSNGKTATITQQQSILKQVRDFETKSPSPLPAEQSDFFTNPKQLDLLDGLWYLQYTSPSEIKEEEEEEINEEDAVWKPTIAEDDKIETRQLKSSQGSVSAAGIKVDVSNKPTKQIIDVKGGTIRNEVELENLTVVVGGSFRPSDRVGNRAIASFNFCNITFKKLGGITLDLGFVFSIIGLIKGTTENGWLETTYLDDDVRIGRGNKGTMFILTRDGDAVQP